MAITYFNVTLMNDVEKLSITSVLSFSRISGFFLLITNGFLRLLLGKSYLGGNKFVRHFGRFMSVMIKH